MEERMEEAPQLWRREEKLWLKAEDLRRWGFEESEFLRKVYLNSIRNW